MFHFVCLKLFTVISKFKIENKMISGMNILIEPFVLLNEQGRGDAIEESK
ncbi:hypothetical protein LINPERHAP1_LOCUS23598 [Linum perenne]